RKRRSPIDVKGEEGPKGLLFPPKSDRQDRPIQGSEIAYVSRGIKLWPPDDAPQEIVDFLCPSKRANEIQAVADERSFIYCTSDTQGKKVIILVSFDPKIVFPGMKSLDTKMARATTTEAPVDIERPKIGDDMRKYSTVIQQTLPP